MKGYRFYLEYGSKANKRKGIHEGNVYAAILRDDGNFDWHLSYYSGPEGTKNYALTEGVGALYFHPNSDVVFTPSLIDRLHDECKRIPEWKARQIHPLLFQRIEETERSADDVSR